MGKVTIQMAMTGKDTRVVKIYDNMGTSLFDLEFDEKKLKAFLELRGITGSVTIHEKPQNKKK